MKIKIKEAANMYQKITGCSKSAFYHQIKRGSFKTVETIDGKDYVDSSEFYAHLPIDKNGKPLKSLLSLIKMYDLPPSKVNSCIASGKIPVKRIGKRKYIDPDDVQFLVKEKEIASSDEYVLLTDYAKQYEIEPVGTLVAFAAKGKIPSAVKAMNKWYVRKDDSFLHSIAETSIPEGYVAIAEYAKMYNIPLMKVKNDFRRGLYSSAMVIERPNKKEKWFIHKNDKAIDEVGDVQKMNFISLSQAAKICGLTSGRMVQRVNQGYYKTAKKVKGNWYINESELAEPTNLIPIKEYCEIHDISINVMRYRIKQGNVKSAVKRYRRWYIDRDEKLD